MTPAVEDLAAIRQAVERASAFLADPSPPSLDRGTAELEQALRQLATFRGGLCPGCESPPARTAFLSEAERLRIAIYCAARLLQGAADFFSGWNRRLGELLGGYTAHGDAAPVPRLSHLSLHG